MRSTPWPNDTLRTVNDARVPPRCTPITTPSKTWMRSLSPSRTFTCTRTVSPDFIAGRSINCAFSTNSSALMADSQNWSTSRWTLRTVGPEFHRLQLRQYRPLFVVERRGFEQLRPSRQRPRDRLPLAPSPDLRMVPGHQHLGHPLRSHRGGSSVVRKIEQAAAERILRHGLIVADNTWHEPRDRIDDDERGQLASAQHVVANRPSPVDSRPAPLAPPLIPPAQHHDIFFPPHRFGARLRQPRALRRHQQHGRVSLKQSPPGVN